MKLPRLAGLAAGMIALGLGVRLLRNGLATRGDSALDRRVVLITGGGRGLGIALARECAALGARVAICGRSADTLERAAQTFAADGIAVETVVCDVRDRASVEHAVGIVSQRLGTIDVLINNAGVIEVGAVEDQTLGDFAESIDTHVWGPLYGTLAVLPSMRVRGSGSIVNIASVGGVIAPPHLLPYSVGKFALVGLSQGLAAELRPHGITVTTVTPGLMRTGSPDNATFKGDNRAEYAWFTVAEANPLISISAEAAARRIVRGIVRREALVTVGATAQLARIANAVAPETTSRLLALTAALLPKPGGSARRLGRQSHSVAAPSVLTVLDRIAARQNNERDSMPGE